MGNYRIIVTQRGVCNQLFYDEITQFGNIHNGYVKMNEHNQITGLKWLDDITIDEKETYDDVKLTMEKLCSDITKKSKTNTDILANQYIHWHMLFTLTTMIGKLLVNVLHKYMTYEQAKQI